MTAPELSEAEAEIVARFEAAPAAPESFRPLPGEVEMHRAMNATPEQVDRFRATAGGAAVSTCLEPIWDGPYRMRCSMGTAGICHRHGPHKPHPTDGRPCDPMDDGYCSTHGVYVDPT